MIDTPGVKMDRAYLAISTYMRRVAELTSSIEKDIKENKKISASTVMSLSRLHASTSHMTKLMALVEKKYEPIN